MYFPQASRSIVDGSSIPAGLMFCQELQVQLWFRQGPETCLFAMSLKGMLVCLPISPVYLILIAPMVAPLEGNTKLLPVNSPFTWHVSPPDLLPPPRWEGNRVWCFSNCFILTVMNATTCSISTCVSQPSPRGRCWLLGKTIYSVGRSWLKAHRRWQWWVIGIRFLTRPMTLGSIHWHWHY